MWTRSYSSIGNFTARVNAFLPLTVSWDDGILSDEKSWTILFKILLQHCALAHPLICTVSVCAQGNWGVQKQQANHGSVGHGEEISYSWISSESNPACDGAKSIFILPAAVRSISSHMSLLYALVPGQWGNWSLLSLGLPGSAFASSLFLFSFFLEDESSTYGPRKLGD